VEGSDFMTNRREKGPLPINIFRENRTPEKNSSEFPSYTREEKGIGRTPRERKEGGKNSVASTPGKGGVTNPKKLKGERAPF